MKRFVILLVAILAVVGLWTGGWFYVAGQVRANIAAYAEADGVATPRITCAMLDVGGFPFKFSPHCAEPEIVSGDYTIRLADLAGTALFYRPNHLQIFANGPAQIVDAFTGSEQQVSWSSLRASLRLEGGELERLSVVADDIVYADALFGDATYAEATHAEFHVLDAVVDDEASMPGNVVDLYLMLEGVNSVPLGIADGTGDIDARLTGMPPMALWGHPDFLRIWAGNGGVAMLRDLSLDADTVMVNATGEARVSETGLIEASLELASEGVIERIDALQADPRAPLLTGAPDDEGIYRQNISVRGGTVFVGLIPVMGLAPIF
ncbi:DUF2125 domain-containing protein [Pelagibacterium xiamenense]|uniref:DUF2125 domain-containing protein n=1 Tax=Pelagibacterium xiamenense TaxID=2901140 RepID=UPI001E4C9786|nr:DUF2125 domain-containing protein [Pelagibacterium xiamenense]MCD7061290.1 DUF2125 domain-containing protein [Pelagibacterium xiamenense]